MVVRFHAIVALALSAVSGKRLELINMGSDKRDEPAKIRVLLVEGTNHPGRGDNGYYNIPLHVDYWKNALASLADSHGIGELSVGRGNVIVDPAAASSAEIPPGLLRKLHMNAGDLEDLSSMDALFARETDAAKGSIKKQLQAFVDTLGPDDVSILVFSGHGVQINGELHLLFANPLFPAIKQQVPRRVWSTAGCQNLLGQWLCLSYDEVKQLFAGKGRLSVHMIGACRVTRDPRFNFDEADAGDPSQVRESFLHNFPVRGAPANVVTVFGTVPGSPTWHGVAQDLGESLEDGGYLNSEYIKRLKQDARGGHIKYQSAYFQERIVGALGRQCAANASGHHAPTVYDWIGDVAQDEIVRMHTLRNGEELTFSQQPSLEWGSEAKAAARKTMLVFDTEKCFDRLNEAL